MKITILNDLTQFTGTENYYFDPLFKDINYTDGIKYLRDNGANWLVLYILTHIKTNKKLQKNLDFLSIKFSAKDNTGVLTIGDGNDSIIIKENIPYTDFPNGEITLFYMDNVLFLASEY